MTSSYHPVCRDEAEWREKQRQMGTEMGKGRFCAKTRCIFVLFIAVVVSIVIVCCITFLSSDIRVHVKPTPELTWWQKSIVYQIYPRSFQDSDGDGTGDLRGIISRLPYLNHLGVGAVWLSPFYKSPMKDFGYDVSDYKQVDPLFGTLKDFEEMVTAAHSLGIKFIVDFVPNHSSDKHMWFQLSRYKTGKYKDYYIWADGKLLENGTRTELNKWKSTIQGLGSAWQWDQVRQQYYYHAYLKEQPDLNYRNPDVVEEMNNVLRFWLDRGVDGFRIDAIPHLYEVANLSMDILPGDKDQIGYRFTLHQPEIFDSVRTWRSVLDEYESKDGKVRWLLAEAFGISPTDRQNYYKAGSTPFFFDLLVIKRVCKVVDARCIRNIIKKGVNLTLGEWPTFVTGSHDVGRVSDRIGHEFVDAFNMLLLTLPGTPTTYYGEEIGMRNGNYTGLRPKDTFALSSGNWSKSRDPGRNPMQWNTSINAGFSAANPDKLWLPITTNTDYRHLNVEVESQKHESSLSIYQRLAALRQEPAFMNPNIELTQGTNENRNILAYIRSDGSQRFAIVINFGETTSVSIDTSQQSGVVEVATGGIFDRAGKTINLSNVTLKKGDGLVIRLL